MPNIGSYQKIMLAIAATSLVLSVWKVYNDKSAL